MFVHFTTVHPRDDSRIRSKMVRSLHAEFGGDVVLCVQDGLGNEVDVTGFVIEDTGPRMRRTRRMTLGGFLMIRHLIRLRPQIAHFHDPELIPWALVLKIIGIKVIYDVHEDYPEAITENYRLMPWLRKMLPPIVRVIEVIAGYIFDGFVPATEHIARRFPPQKTVVIRNLPVIAEFPSSNSVRVVGPKKTLAYVGTLTMNRNIIGMLDVVERLNTEAITLRLAGDFPVENDANLAMQHSGWSRVKFEGWLSREGVASMLRSAYIGLLLIKPIEHEAKALPIKMFEYMAAGLPIIASNFPDWEKIIDGEECGVCVDPLDTHAIADAVKALCDDERKGQMMGANGRAAVLREYNWGLEVRKLVALYERLSQRTPRSGAIDVEDGK